MLFRSGIEATRQLRSAGHVAVPEVVLVTAYGREEFLREADEAGIAGSLVKPVNPSTLFDVVMHVLGGEASLHEGDEIKSNISSEELARIRGAKILLAEDNVLNQQVAIELLKQAGFDVDLAENGQISVDMRRSGDYDLVLMDMQMPVMDGLTAAREIRKEDAELPILAMTANAMEQDREACLEAGMNDHIAKPIDPELLVGKLIEYIPPREQTDSPPEPVVTSEVRESSTMKPELDPLQQVDGIDFASGLRNVANNREFYERLLREFVTGDESRAIPTIAEQLHAGDVESAERTAHSLKGVAGTLGIAGLQAMSQELEAAIREGGDVDTHMGQVDRELTRILADLNAVLPAESLPEQTDESKSEVDPEKIPDLLKALEAHSDNWENLSETLSINDIESFANEVGSLGAQYGSGRIAKWGEELASQASMFELDKMGILMKAFPNLIAELEATSVDS